MPADRGESSYPEKGPKAVHQQKCHKRKEHNDKVAPQRSHKEPRTRKSLLRQDKAKSRMEDDQTWSHRMLEVTQFTESTCSKRLLEEIRMPENFQPNDGNEDPVEYVGVFQLAARVYNWNVATQCHKLECTRR